MKLLIGLGNPGRAYERTRHNIGFMVIDALAAEMGLDINKKQADALVGQGFLGTDKVLLVKPQTYMNRSGNSVMELLNFYGDRVSDFLVLHDDLDLEFGRLRLRSGGGTGGHKGLKSIGQMINSLEFDRLKIGIGRPPELMKVENYVLSAFLPEEQALIPEFIKVAVAAIKTWSSEGISQAMNEYNGTSLKTEKSS